MKNLCLFACLCLAVLVLCGPVSAGLLDGVQVSPGVLFENGQSAASVAAIFPVDADGVASGTLVEFGKESMADGNLGRQILGVVSYVGGKALAHTNTYVVLKGVSLNDAGAALPLDLLVRPGLGASFGGEGKFHIAVTINPADIRRETCGLYLGGVLWSN